MKKINSFSEYQDEYDRSVENPEGFWDQKANTFNWFSKYNFTSNLSSISF